MTSFGISRKSITRQIAGFLAIVMASQTATIPLAEAAMIAQPVIDPAVSSKISGAGIGARPAGRAEFIAPFKIPASVGATVEVHAPVSAGRLIYHLQDVHGHSAAQTNLSEMISRLESYAAAQKKSLLVAVEGAVGPIDTDTISAHPSAAVKEAVSAALLRNGFLLGEEHAAVNRAPGRIRIVGVETPSLYNRNVLARERSAQGRERILATVREIKSQLNRLKEHNFNALLNTLENNRLAVEKGDLGMSEYLTFLSRTSPAITAKYPMVARMVALSEQEKNVDFATVEKEGRLLVEEIISRKSDRDVRKMMNDATALREGRLSPLVYYNGLLAEATKIYPSLKTYVSYLRSSEAVNPDRLFVEVQNLETEIARDLVRHPLAYQLYKNIRWIERQEKFFALNMIPQEWELQRGVDTDDIFQAHAEIRDFVAEQVADLGYRFATPPFSKSDLRVAVRGASDFYRAAEARDVEMVSNIEKVLKKNGRDNVIVAFIAGGFHTPGVTRSLRGKGLAYQVIRPQLETEIALNADINYPDIKAEARLLPERSVTDFLRPTSRLPNGGAEAILRTMQQGGAQAPRVTRENRDLEASATSLPERIRQIWRPITSPTRFYTGAEWAFLIALVLTVGITIGYVYHAAINAAVIVVNRKRQAFTDWLNKVRQARSDDDAFDRVSDQRTRVPAGGEGEARLNEAQVARLLEAAETFGFDRTADLSDIVYIGTLWNLFLNPRPELRMYTTDTAAPLNPAQPQPGDPKDANFQVSAIAPNQTFPALGVINLVDDIQAKDAVENSVRRKAATQVRVTVDSLDGGIGENYTRALDIVERVGRQAGVILEPVLGAKGTDLVHEVQVQRSGTDLLEGRADGIALIPNSTETREVSVAELKLLQLIKNREQFGALAFEPLVNKDSMVSYEKLLDRPYLGDLLDDRIENKRSYRQALADAGVEVRESHLQKDIFGIEEETLQLANKTDVPKQPGGHAQLGFWFFFEALKAATQRTASTARQAGADALTSIRVFYNGDNLNSRPNAEIVGNMKLKKHVIYMVATPAEAIDKKGGKVGIRWEKINGEFVPVPDMMEIAQAKSAEQLDPFYAAGQEDGLGVAGRQLFNTNQVYINEDLLGDILFDLRELFKRRDGITDDFEADLAVARAFSPTLIRKTAKSGYFPIDGAVGSVLLNLNAFFILNKNDLEIAGILSSRGIDRLVHFVEVPRMETFTPEKFPSDHVLYRSERFTIDSNRPFAENEWTLVDRQAGQPLPNLEFLGAVDGKETGSWKADAGRWADLATLKSVLGRLDLNQTTYLGFYGLPVQLPQGTRIIGAVRITNHQREGHDGRARTDLRQPSFVEQIADTGGELARVDNGTFVFTNANVVIRADGALEIQPFNAATQPISAAVPLVLSAVLLAAFSLSFGSAPLGIDAASAFISTVLGIITGVTFVLGAIGAVITRLSVDVPPGTTPESVLSDPRFDTARVQAVIDFAAQAKRTEADPLNVVLRPGVLAEVDPATRTLYVGTGLLKSGGLFGFVRGAALHVALRHEAIHLGRVQLPATNAFYRFINEVIAYTLGTGAIFVPNFVLYGPAVTPVRGDAPYLQPEQQFSAAGEADAKFVEAVAATLTDEVYNNPESRIPTYVAIDADSVGLGNIDDVGITGFVGLNAGLNRMMRDVQPGAQVVVYTASTDGAQLARLRQLVDISNRDVEGVTYVLQQVAGAVADARDLFESGVRANITDGNTVILTQDPALTLVNARSYQVMGIPHLAVATFTFSHYSDGEAVLTALLSVLKDFKIEIGGGITNKIMGEIVAKLSA